MLTINERMHAPSTRLFVEVLPKQNEVSGSPFPLFILPGGPGANSTHFISYRCLQDAMDIVFHDPRGCGNSDNNNPSSYSLDNYIDDIEAIRASLGFPKIALLGKSYSGLCALGYAIRYPEALGKLILVATGPSHHFIPTAKAKLAQIGNKEQIQASEKLWGGRFTSCKEVDDYFTLMTPLYSTKALSTDSTPQETEVLPFAYEPLNRGFQKDLCFVDYVNELNKITCPTLIMTGDSDWIFDQKYSQLMAEKIPNAQMVIFENAGHFLETDAPSAEFYNRIRSFML